MIWHIQADQFYGYLESIGFRRAAQSSEHILYIRGRELVTVRRSSTLTQAEVDGICDAIDLVPPLFDTFFGD